MKHDNNNYDAPKAYCDKHGTGYVKSIGCADCNAKQEVTEDKNNINNVVSVRIFPEPELVKMANEGTIKLVVRIDKNTDPFGFGPNRHYLFVHKDNQHLLYTKINKTQAMEITIDVTPKVTP